MKNSNRIRLLALTLSMLCIVSSNVLAQGGKQRDRDQDRMHKQKIEPDAIKQRDRLQDRDRDDEKDFDRIRDRERDRDIDVYYERNEDSVGGKIYGSHLMNMEERNAYRQSLRDAETDEQREQLREQHRQEILERAKVRKMKVPG